MITKAMLAAMILFLCAQARAEEAVIPSEFNIYDHLVAGNFAGKYDPPSWGDEGAMRFECQAGHLNYDDPIAYPGIEGGSPHLHHYFGNTLTNYASSYKTLRSSGEGTCQGGPVNRTAYWFPALIRPQNNAVVKPDYVMLYYKTIRRNITAYTAPGSGRSQQAAQTFPRGLKFISGFNFATNQQDQPGALRWVCEDGSGDAPTLEALAAQTSCTGPVKNTGQDAYQARIMLRFGAPACWDGVNLDSADHRAHMAYGTEDFYGHNLCPETHPVPLPTISFIMAWSHNGAADFGQWFLSSDRMPGHVQYQNGQSFHADWIGAWDTTVQGMWSKFCNGIGNTDVLNGVDGQLCTPEGYAMKRTWSLGPTPEPDRYAQIPPRPTAALPHDMPPTAANIDMTTVALPDAKRGVLYSQRVAVIGGAPPYKFVVSSGSLPSGVKLGADGTFAGTPTRAGTTSCSVTATDATGRKASKSLSIKVQ